MEGWRTSKRLGREGKGETMDENMEHTTGDAGGTAGEPLMPLSMPFSAREDRTGAGAVQRANADAPTELLPLMPLSMPYPAASAVGASGSSGATPPPAGPSSWTPSEDEGGSDHRSGQRHRVAALVALVALVAGGAGAAIGISTQQSTPSSSSTGINALPSTSSTPAPSKSGTNFVTSVAAAVTPAVVDIQTTIATQTGTTVQQAAGTGMIVTPSGEVLTNNHVIADATSIKVTIQGRKGLFRAHVLGVDPPQTSDIALLQIEGVSNLPYVHLGDSSQVKVGQPVVAIGNALGIGGSPSVVNGIVSATNRTINASDSTGAATETLHGLIQTDAPIVPGDSGGPLVNAAGQVIGIDTAASGSQTGGATLGFAIPINTARAIVTNIENHVATGGIILGESPYLGIFEQTVSAFGGNGFSFNSGNSGNTGNTGNTGTAAPAVAGVTLGGVAIGSPADQAGLLAGDVITAINGTKTPTWSALVVVIQRLHPGDVITMSYVDASSVPHTVSLKLAGIPK